MLLEDRVDVDVLAMFLRDDLIKSVNLQTNLLFDMPVPSPLNCPYSLIHAAQMVLMLIVLMAAVVAALESAQTVGASIMRL